MGIPFPASALVIVALVAQAAAQPPAIQPFRTSVDVVRADVSAIDGNGAPVTDLTVDDFELRVDGKPRTIVSAQFIAVPSSQSPSAQASSPQVSSASPPDLRYSSNDDAAGGRLIMVVVDRTSIVAGRGKAAIEAASRFVKGLNRADRVALATIPLGPQVPFTADHALVERRIQEIDGNAIGFFGVKNLGITDALAFERRDDLRMDQVIERECGIASSSGAGAGGGGGQSEVATCIRQVRAEALGITQDARERARTSISGLRRLIESLPPSQTPKMMVLISEGLVIDREVAQLAWLDAKAAAAHVTIYALHLEPSHTDASQAKPLANPSSDRVIQAEGLQQLAMATRGDVFRIISNSDFAFQRLARELSGYYLLAFEPVAGDRNGKPHDISVRVRRRGVNVRSRRQFVIDDKGPARTTEDEIIAALRDPLPAADIPIKLAAYSFRDPRHDKLRLLVAAEIDRSTNPNAQVSAGYVVVDFDGQHVASQMDSPIPDTARRDGTTQRYFSTVQADPGKYTIKFAAVDGVRRGSVEMRIDAGLTQAGPVRVTDLMLADGAGRAGELPVAPVVSGDVKGDLLNGYLELFADAPDTLERASVTLEIVRPDTSAVLQRIPVTLATTKETVGCRIASARVNISRLPPGSYLARAVVAVGLNAVGEVSRPFRVVGR